MRNGFAVEHTEDPNRFTNAELAPFAAVVFLHTTGDVLNSQQQAAFEKFIRDGGGFAGIHSAADTEYEWPWYGELVGAYFKSHPAVQSATVQIKSADHPSTRCLPSTWSRSDEWYDYQSQPVAGIDVLATLDEASYQGGTMGMPHPISWARTFDGGKAWYTGMGHTPESWSDTLFIRHIAGGLLWAAAK
jgi:type 1 glutamine amidotransferase